jgi:adhesin/invasin
VDIPVDRFVFDTISDQEAGVNFSILITATDTGTGTVEAYNGTANLSVNAGGSIFPTSATFVNGVASLNVRIADPADGVIITATDGTITGQSNAFNVRALDHFTFDSIADQAYDEAFAVTLNAIDSTGAPMSISATVILTDTTGTISPTTVSFANQSSRSPNVTIGVTATNVVITATYNTITGTSNAFDVLEDVGPQLDHFTFAAIDDQAVNEAFGITVNALDDSSSPIAITATVTLTDSTGTISPTTVSFANQSSHSPNVTIGVTATNVVITATYNTITGTSNAFDILADISHPVYLPLVIKD